jgi:hypothetical protein
VVKAIELYGVCNQGIIGVKGDGNTKYNDDG